MIICRQNDESPIWRNTASRNIKTFVQVQGMFLKFCDSESKKNDFSKFRFAFTLLSEFGLAKRRNSNWQQDIKKTVFDKMSLTMFSAAIASVRNQQTRPQIANNNKIIVLLSNINNLADVELSRTNFLVFWLSKGMSANF